MKFQLENPDDGYVIESYGKGQIVVNEHIFTSSLVIGPEKNLREWAPKGIPDLVVEHFEGLLEHDPEIIIFGSGEKQHFPAPDLLRPLIRRGVALEAMNTAAACRTYNILVSENRRVIAALLLI